jgi:hypothetical protein
MDTTQTWGAVAWRDELAPCPVNRLLTIVERFCAEEQQQQRWSRLPARSHVAQPWSSLHR